MKITASELRENIAFHGTPLPHQMTVYTCYGLGLGRFLTDQRGLAGYNAARAHFKEQAKKAA